jgi:hypothetical protein
MLRTNKNKLAVGLCALVFMTSALLAGCDAGASPTPTPNPTRTFGPGVYRHAPDARAIEASSGIASLIPMAGNLAQHHKAVSKKLWSGR